MYDKWSNTDAPSLLALYGVYLLLIGVNGLIEAHRDAISPYSLIQQSTGFTFFFVVFYFVLGAPFMSYFGAGGMIAASCINTLTRTIFNLRFFSDFLLPIQDGVPSSDLLISFAILFAVGTTARYVLGDTMKLLVVGMIEGLVYVAWLYLFKRKELVQTYQVVKQKKI